MKIKSWLRAFVAYANKPAVGMGPGAPYEDNRISSMQGRLNAMQSRIDRLEQAVEALKV